MVSLGGIIYKQGREVMDERKESYAQIKDFAGIKTEADFMRAILYGTLSSLYEFSLKNPEEIKKEDTDELDSQLHVLGKSLERAYQIIARSGKIIDLTADGLANLIIWFLIVHADGGIGAQKKLTLNLVEGGEKQLQQFDQRLVILLMTKKEADSNESTCIMTAIRNALAFIIAKSPEQLLAAMSEPSEEEYILVLTKLEETNFGLAQKFKDQDQIVQSQLQLLAAFESKKILAIDASTLYAQLARIRLIQYQSVVEVLYEKLFMGYLERGKISKQWMNGLRQIASGYCFQLHAFLNESSSFSSTQFQLTCEEWDHRMAKLQLRVTLHDLLIKAETLYRTLAATSLILIPIDKRRCFRAAALKHGENQIADLSDFLDQSESLSLAELQCKVVEWNERIAHCKARLSLYVLFHCIQDNEMLKERADVFMQNANATTKELQAFKQALEKDPEYLCHRGLTNYMVALETSNLLQRKQLLHDAMAYFAQSLKAQWRVKPILPFAKAYTELISLLKINIESERDLSTLKNALIAAYSLYDRCSETDCAECQHIINEIKRLGLSLPNEATMASTVDILLGIADGAQFPDPFALQKSAGREVESESAFLSEEEKVEAVKEVTVHLHLPLPSQSSSRLFLPHAFGEKKLDHEITETLSGLFVLGLDASTSLDDKVLEKLKELDARCEDTAVKASVWEKLKQSEDISNVTAQFLQACSKFDNVKGLMVDLKDYKKHSQQLKECEDALCKKTALAQCGAAEQLGTKFNDFRRSTPFFGMYITLKPREHPEVLSASQRRIPRKELLKNIKICRHKMGEIDKKYAIEKGAHADLQCD